MYYPVHPVVDGMKVCLICRLSKPVAEFPIQRQNKNGLRPYCKPCQNIKGAEQYQKHKDKITARARAYNRTEHRRTYSRNYVREHLRREREAQASRARPTRCECCGSVGDKRGIVYDHDHSTGDFRGWLCNRCNTALGLCQDNVGVLHKLITYLQESEYARDQAHNGRMESREIEERVEDRSGGKKPEAGNRDRPVGGAEGEE